VIYFNKEIGVHEVVVQTELGHHEKYLEITERDAKMVSSSYSNKFCFHPSKTNLQ
jgi:hypothetical protein